MTEAILKEAQSKIDKAIEVAKEDFATIRTGRANASMFNKISADYYGTQTPLNQMATFQTPKARTTNAYLLINNEAMTKEMRTNPIAVARGRFLPV